MKSIEVEVPQSRLNPFAFPSATTLRFILLIIALIGAILVISVALYFDYLQTQGKFREIAGLVSECKNNIEPLGSLLQKAAKSTDPTNVFNLGAKAYNQCNFLLNQERHKSGWFALCFVGALLGFASFIHSFLPFLIIRWEGLVSLEQQPDMEEVIANLNSLCQEIGIVHPPKFLLNPRSRAIGGRAFGSLGRYYLVLPVGLITFFETDPDAFRAVMLHELAHIRNADVDKIYFSLIASCILGLTTLTVFLLIWKTDRFQAIWRIIALILLVYLTLTAVVRTREFYADVRASIHLRSDSLDQLLAKSHKFKHLNLQSAFISLLEYLPYFRHNPWKFALQFHPNSFERRKALERTDSLFQFNYWEAFATGIAVSVPFKSVDLVLADYVVTTPGIIMTEKSGLNLILLLQELITPLIFASIIVGIVGLGVWREVFVALVHNTHYVKAGRLGISLGLGLILGQNLSFYGMLETPIWHQHPITITWYLVWGALFLFCLYYFFEWLATGATAWLRVAISLNSPRPFYINGLIIASVLLTLLLGAINIIQLLVEVFTPNSILSIFSNSILVLFFLYTNFINEPLIIAFILLWAYPLSIWFWRERLVDSIPVSNWVFLEQPSHQIRINIQTQLQLGYTFSSSLKGGLIYCCLLVAIRLLLRVTLPEAIKETDSIKLMIFYVAHVGLAALIQTGIAVKVSKKVKELSIAHGLLAAFVTGCVMSIATLSINLMFGGTIDVQFVWLVFSHILNLGAFLALLAMMVAYPLNRSRQLI
ncbi:M48 family metalloprotease [Nostoc linckia FACHB-104]|nr:M48 family metalloprotease [Nostoc linckia FACHB-104]